MDVEQAPHTVTKMDDGFSLKLVGTVSYDLAWIEQEFARIVDAKPKRVYLDLAGCAYVSSAGMGALVSLFSKVRASGGTVKITAIRKLVFGSFRVGRLDQLFGIGPEAILK